MRLLWKLVRFMKKEDQDGVQFLSFTNHTAQIELGLVASIIRDSVESVPQGLKPRDLRASYGATEVVP